MTQWFRFGFGRLEVDDDAQTLDSLRVAFRDSGADVRELLIAIAMSDAFVTRDDPEAM